MILWRASLRTTGTSPLEMSLLTHRWSRYTHWEHHNSIMLNYCYKSISSNDFRYYQYSSIPISADTDDAAKGPVEELSFSHKSNSTRWEKSSDLITLITMISHDIMISWYHDIIVTIPQEKHDQDKNCGRRTDDKFHFSSTFSPPCNERWSHRKFGGRLQYWLDHKSMKLNFQTWFPFHLPIVSNVKYLNPQNMSTIYFQSMNLEFDGVNKFQLCESRFGRKSNKSWESPFAGCIFQFSDQLVGNNFSVVSLSNFLSCVIFQIFQSNGSKQFLSCVTFQFS